MVSHEEIMEMRNNAAASKNNKDYWSEANDKVLRKMYYAGYGILEIAIKMGGTENSIGKRIKDFKLDAKRYQTGEKKQKSGNCLCKNCRQYRENFCNGPTGMEVPIN